MQIEISAEETSSGKIGISLPGKVTTISEDDDENFQKQVYVDIVREGGLYGNVSVSWEIYPDQPNTFEVVKGDL